ncbi:NADH-quinone oxidoreductase subunit NuoG [Aquimonas voraii]|uniref:NADH-quinone oxidoreductase n=1 Tax=Aquimonas voraii TaxID=265719 RepID=A0A1G6UF38_9GAMM|nr:NADH-quinone oxidoreductase subunit NuoG [Aquimonas voraii]SDD39913.1 NADH dehydrogenase subunit G [Aquimonas voraii]
MSAAPSAPNVAPDQVNIEIDGTAMAVPKGSMIIEAADKAGIPIPRFCYHKKLPIAANCRMCLVDVEKMPKPAPACATPVMEGMKIYTQSKRALDSQRNVMEFLLINHPLDCPICDQGGECELQDVAMGYGRSVSRFVERKRVVPDENVGPLVATDMTRCIHCTRCVRFVGEIAGTYELGGMGRGDRLEIGTYIGKNIDSELSGNIIDVCPVGALTNKPFRYRARAWELAARESIGYHDALGSNLYLHVRRGEVMRVVPRDNESINESWLSDRDRYSHTGLTAADRATTALVREGANWKEVSLEQGVARAADLLRAASGEQTGMLVHPSTSLEEGALLARLAAGLGCGNIDHRLGTLDFADAPVAAAFELPLAEVEQARAVLLVGCNPRLEAPILGHRIRKASKGGAKISAINPVDFDFNFDLSHKAIVAPQAMTESLAAVLAAAGGAAEGLPAELASLVANVQVEDGHRAVAEQLKSASVALIQLGESAVGHANASWLRALASALSRATGARLNVLERGANALGLARAGVLPKGLDARAMFAQPRSSYMLYGVEPEFDFADNTLALQALSQAKQVVAFSAFVTETLKRCANVILPIALLPEIEASLINAQGQTQLVSAGAKAPGEARAGWRLLRALGEAMKLDGFDFIDIHGLRAGITLSEPKGGAGLSKREPVEGLQRIATTPIYRSDAVLRRAEPLNAHSLTRGPRVLLNAADALAAGLSNGAMAKVGDGRGQATLQVEVSGRVPRGAVWIETGYGATAPLAPAGALTVAKV